jgi:hypothetical protein
VRSYDYAHREGVEEISWERFALLSRKLAEGLAGLSVEVVVGIARAGLLPATAVACALLVSDALVIFPWDQRVYLDGRWQLHPELREAMDLQGRD